MQFTGVIPILQTPFTDSAALDTASLSKEVEFACNAGADGVAFPGFASEWWKLSDTELFQAAETILETNRTRIPVILNVTAQATHLAVQCARRFVAMGCNGLMCLPPFVAGITGRQILSHLAAVLDATPAPFILQCSPSLTGSNLELDQLHWLEQKFSNLVSIKVDFIPPGPAITRLITEFGGERFALLIGFAGLQLSDAMARGAHGLMGGCGHLEEDISVFRAFQKKDQNAGELFRGLLPLLNFEMQTIHQSIATHKWLLHKRGIFLSGEIREPGTRLDSFQIQELESYFNRGATFRIPE